MSPRRKRLFLVLGSVAGVAMASALALNAFQDNVLYYYSPSQVAAGEVAPDDERRIRVGGLVEEGSIDRLSGDMAVSFDVTDGEESVHIRYEGILPNLFREGQGIIAHGRFADAQTFEADEIVAKHDENYMAPELKDSIPETEWQRRARESDGDYGEEY